jgi:hypothetical protein
MLAGEGGHKESLMTYEDLQRLEPQLRELLALADKRHALGEVIRFLSSERSQVLHSTRLRVVIEGPPARIEVLLPPVTWPAVLEAACMYAKLVDMEIETSVSQGHVSEASAGSCGRGEANEAVQ